MTSKIVRASLALGLAHLMWTAGPVRAAEDAVIGTELEGIIQRHLDWLAANPQFRADLSLQYGEETGYATLDVNRVTGETAFLAKTPGLPDDIYLKTESQGDRTVLLSFARDLDRADDIPLRERELPPAPFAGDVYDVFVPEDGVAGAMERLQQLAVTVTVVPASQLGVHGMRIEFNQDFLGQFLESMASFMGQEAAPQSPEEVTLWFDGIGRLTAAETVQDWESPVQVTTLTYPEPSISESETPPVTPAPPVRPPDVRRPEGLLSPSAAPVQDFVAPMALSWLLVAGLSVVLGGLSLALLVRLRIHAVEE